MLREATDTGVGVKGEVSVTTTSPSEVEVVEIVFRVIAIEDDSMSSLVGVYAGIYHGLLLREVAIDAFFPHILADVLSEGLIFAFTAYVEVISISIDNVADVSRGSSCTILLLDGGTKCGIEYRYGIGHLIGLVTRVLVEHQIPLYGGSLGVAHRDGCIAIVVCGCGGKQHVGKVALEVVKDHYRGRTCTSRHGMSSGACANGCQVIVGGTLMPMRFDERLYGYTIRCSSRLHTCRGICRLCLLDDLCKAFHHIHKGGRHVFFHIVTALCIANNLGQAVVSTHDDKARVIATVNEV